jgi:hypothetical protein
LIPSWSASKKCRPADERAEKLRAELVELTQRFATSAEDAMAYQSQIAAVRADMAALRARPWWRRLAGWFAAPRTSAFRATTALRRWLFFGAQRIARSLEMKNIALGVLSALALGAAVVGTAAPARAGGYGFDAYDEPTTVITRRTTVERRIVRPRPIVHREVVIERPVIYRPRPIVREVVVERPVVYRPRRFFREEFVERDGFYGPRPFRRGPYGIGYDEPGFGWAYDWLRGFQQVAPETARLVNTLHLNQNWYGRFGSVWH